MKQALEIRLRTRQLAGLSASSDQFPGLSMYKKGRSRVERPKRRSRPPIHTEKESPQPHVRFAFGFWNSKPRPLRPSEKSRTVPARNTKALLGTYTSMPFWAMILSASSGPSTSLRTYWRPEQPPPCTATLRPKCYLAVFLREFANLAGRLLRHADRVYGNPGLTYCCSHVDGGASWNKGDCFW